MVTVTKHNVRAYLVEIPVIEPEHYPVCPDQTVLQLAGLVSAGESEWHSMVELPVAAPKIRIDELHFIGGDFDPGTVRQLDITIRNIGSKRLEASTAVLLIDRDIIRIIDPQTVYEQIGIDRTDHVVATLADDFLTTGNHAQAWDAGQLPSGVHLARLEAGNEVRMKKLVCIR